MSSLHFAGGIIQGIADLSIAGRLGYPRHLPIFFSSIAGWQLFSMKAIRILTFRRGFITPAPIAGIFSGVRFNIY